MSFRSLRSFRSFFVREKNFEESLRYRVVPFAIVEEENTPVPINPTIIKSHAHVIRVVGI
jgi:hypothetical protein